MLTAVLLGAAEVPLSRLAGGRWPARNALDSAPRLLVAEGWAPIAVKELLQRRTAVLTETLWFLPGAIVLAFAVLAIVLPGIERRLDTEDLPFVFPGDAQAARNVLSSVSGSVITVAGLTLSITIVTLQLVASQYTPRALRQVLRDKLTQVTVGTFVGVFVFSLIVLRSIRDTAIPSISVSLSIVFAVAAVGLLLAFLDNVANSIQVGTIASATARSALGVVTAVYPKERVRESAAVRDQPAVADVVLSGEVGRIQAIDTARLERALPRGRWIIEFPLPIGAVVAPETPVALVRGRSREDAKQAVRSAVEISSHRTLAQDEAFAIRLLADIALRAISPGVNDPTTAVLAIDHAGTVLCEVARRFDPPRARTLRNEDLLVIEPRRSFPALLAPLAEIARHCTDRRPLEAVLEALARIAEEAADHGRTERAADSAGTALEALEAARRRIAEADLGVASHLVARALAAASREPTNAAEQSHAA